VGIPLTLNFVQTWLKRSAGPFGGACKRGGSTVNCKPGGSGDKGGPASARAIRCAFHRVCTFRSHGHQSPAATIKPTAVTIRPTDRQVRRVKNWCTVITRMVTTAIATITQTLVLLFAIPSVGGGIGLYTSSLKVHPTTDLMLTRVCVIVAIAVVTILVITVHQFLTRRTWRSVGLIVTAVGLIVAAGLWWPWDLKVQTRWNAHLMARAEAGPPLSPEPPGLQFTVEPPRLQAPPNGPADRFNQVWTKFSVSGIPTGQVLVGNGGRFTFHWPDGTNDTGFIWIQNDDNIFRRVAAEPLGLSPLPAAEPDRQTFTIPLYLPLAKAARVQAEAPGFTMKPTFHLLKFDSIAKYPLQPGPRVMNGMIGVRVAHVETEDQQVLVVFIKTRPVFLVEQLAYYDHMGWLNASEQPIYALFNQAAGKLDTGYRQATTYSHIASVAVTFDSVAYAARGEPPRRRKRRCPKAGCGTPSWSGQHLPKARDSRTR